MATDGLSKFLYATGGTQVGAFSIASGGILSPVTGSPFALNMASIAGEPSGKYLLGVVGQSGTNEIHVFGINSTGAIADVAGSPFTTHYSPISLTVHPSGAWVYTFNKDVVLQGLQPVEGFALTTSTGTLTELSSSPFTALTADGGPIEQSGQFMFALGITVVAGNTVSTVTPYSVDTTTGALSTTYGSLGFPGIQSAAYAVTDAQ